MYADDISVMAPTTIALQKLLDVHVCYEYGITNDLVRNPPKFACIVFKPRRFNPIRSGLFQTANDPRGGGGLLKPPPLRS